MLDRIKILDGGNRGFGFIIADDGTEYFYHIKDVQNGQPIKGQKCEFLAEQGNRGPVAKSIKLDRPLVTDAMIKLVSTTALALAIMVTLGAAIAGNAKMPRELIGHFCADSARNYKRIPMRTSCPVAEDDFVITATTMHVAGEVFCEVLRVIPVGQGRWRVKTRCKPEGDGWQIDESVMSIDRRGNLVSKSF